MSMPRFLGLLATALCLTITAVSAQPPLPPGVKLPPQVKPGMPPGGPAPKPGPGDPKGKNPMPPAPGPGAPGTPPVPGAPPSMPAPGKMAEKKDDIKWPDKVNG